MSPEPHTENLIGSPSSPDVVSNKRAAAAVVKAPEPPKTVAFGAYCFTLQATITQTFIGEIPAGFRVDLQYDPDKALRFDSASSLSLDEQDVLKGAELLSGNDWVSIGSNGLATFDTRITLQVGPVTKEPDDRCVISANIRGRTDLGDCLTASGERLFKGEKRAEIVPAWQKGFPAGSYLPLALSVIFDVPTKGDKPSQDKTYDRCRGLERDLFVAVGIAEYLAGSNSPLNSIRLDFMRVDVPGEASQSMPARDAARPTQYGTVEVAVDAEQSGPEQSVT